MISTNEIYYGSNDTFKIEKTKVTNILFSERTIKFINLEVKKKVFRETGLTIPDQNRTEMITQMIFFYRNTRKMLEDYLTDKHMMKKINFFIRAIINDFSFQIRKELERFALNSFLGHKLRFETRGVYDVNKKSSYETACIYPHTNLNIFNKKNNIKKGTTKMFFY